MPTSPIRNISDTARWAAIYRARESERDDAVFRDPFARRLAGDRGEKIANTIEFSTRNTWSWIARTHLFDVFLLDQLRDGCDMVINLAAGLDARPLRMALPPSLKWVEVDLPEIIAYKEEILAADAPNCQLERFALDLSNVADRRELFQQLGRRADKALILTEGLLIYFTEDEAGSFAEDLSAVSTFQRWIMDLTSPGLLRLLKQKMGTEMGEGAVLRFASAEGPDFFRKFGWESLVTKSILRTARQLKRLPPFLRLLAPLTPEVPTVKQSRQPWGGVGVFKNCKHTNSTRT
jgi:methyltransferase (TIGR00027 family)